MAEDLGIPYELWMEFLRRHHLGPQEQQDFLASLQRADALPVQHIQDLEDDYLEFLHAGGSPTG